MKPRTLYLMKILFEETGYDDGLSLPQIQQRLADYGISSERKALYRDIAALNEFGFTIEKLPTRPLRYRFANRLFTRVEMMLLIDAIQSSRSITQRNAEELITKVKLLASKTESKEFQSRIHVSGRVKMQNDSIFSTLDLIQTAIATGYDISFDYLRYDAMLKPQPTPSAEGLKRIKTPLFLVYSHDKYYALVYDKYSYNHIKSYRVDRMANLILTDKSPAGHVPHPNFDITSFERITPGMFDVKPLTVTLRVTEKFISNIVDLFGVEGITSSVVDESGHKAIMTLKVAPSPVFFGQISQFGGEVSIIKPSSVKQAYIEHLSKTLEAAK